MTEIEYKEKICKNCIHKNCNSDICEKHNDNMKIYRCKDFVSIFSCNKKNCRECGKCD